MAGTNEHVSKPSPDALARAKAHTSFWAWMRDRSERGGMKRWFNWTLVVHTIIGVALAYVVPGELADRAKSVVLPLAGVLVGLTFAWAATAISVVSSPEFRRIMAGSSQGVRGTANYFQLAIFVVLGSTLLWAFVGLGPFSAWPGAPVEIVNRIAAAFLFAVTSLAIAECWSAVNLTRLTLLAFNIVRESDESKVAKEAEEAGVRDELDRTVNA